MSDSIIKYPSSGGGGGTLTGAQNGLHLSTSIVKLGGALTEPTTITGDTVAKQLVFNGVSAVQTGTATDAFFQINVAEDISFGAGAVAASISAPADFTGTSALWVQGGDTGVLVDGGLITSQGIQVQNVAGTGVNIAGLGCSFGMHVSDAITGIFASGNNGYAINATNAGFTSIFSSVNETLNTVPFFGLKNGSLVGPTLESMMILERTTGSIVGAGRGISIDMRSLQAGGGISNTTRLVSRVTNIGTNTSNFEVWGLNANVETQLVTVDGLLNGRVGIGSTITSPTARLHLPAGAAGVQAAPLKFTSGTLQTTPESGAIEFDGTHFYGSIGTTRYKFDQQGLDDVLAVGQALTTNRIVSLGSHNIQFVAGNIGIGITPTAFLHLSSGLLSANSAPLKFTSGSLMTTPEIGAVEFVTDKAYLTITTGAARKEFTINDAALTSGRVPYATTNGRLIDSSNFTWNQASTIMFLSRSDGSGSYTQMAAGLNTVINNATDTATPSFQLLNDNGDQLVLGMGGTNNGFPATTGRAHITYTNTVFYVSGAEWHFSVPKMYFGGDTTATAKIHIAAGSATANTAPLKFTSGTNLTTAETGAIEYNGTNLFFTRTGTTRETVFTGVSGATAPSTTTAAVSTTAYFGTNAAVLTTPISWASVVIAGTTYKIPLYT